MQIWKFDISDKEEVDVPKNAKVVHAGMQNGRSCVWLEVDVPATTERRRFRVYGTGWNIPGDAQHLASVILDGEGLVWHFYEVR